MSIVIWTVFGENPDHVCWVCIISLLYSLITKMYTNCQSETVTYGLSTPSVLFSQTFTVTRFSKQCHKRLVPKKACKDMDRYCIQTLPEPLSPWYVVDNYLLLEHSHHLSRIRVIHRLQGGYFRIIPIILYSLYTGFLFVKCYTEKPGNNLG